MTRLSAHSDYQNIISPVVARGIVWRMAGLGAASGFGLGMIYGVVFPVVASWLNSTGSLGSLEGAIVLGFSLGILFGWVIGGVFGLIWGGVTGLLTGLALALGISYVVKGRYPAATYPRLFAVVSLTLIIFGHAILLLWLSPSYPTIGYWLLNVGFPFAIMAVAFGFISYIVGGWTRDQVNE